MIPPVQDVNDVEAICRELGFLAHALHEDNYTSASGCVDRAITALRRSAKDAERYRYFRSRWERIAWCGWPEGEAALADCELITKADAAQRLHILNLMAESADGPRKRYADRVLKEVS